MRCTVAALLLSLCSVLPVAARADTFNYTLTVDFPANVSLGVDLSTFDGTYSFSESSLLNGDTEIAAPAFTGPTNSPVDLIDIGIYPSENYYYFTLYAANGPASGSNLFPFGATGDFTNGEFATLDVTNVANSPVPEPSTFALVATGILGAVESFRRRARGRTAHT